MVTKYVILANSNDKKFNIPRQLLIINGEPLIARTIRLLKENGVKDILITASDERFKKYGEVYTPNSSDYNYSTGTGYWLNAFPYELMEEPVCFIWGDVYFSEEAIKTIVNTETDKNLFFCSYNNKSTQYIKHHDEPFAYKVIDADEFKKHIEICKKAKDDGTACREPIIWEVYRSMHNIDINTHTMTTDYVVINDITCDIDGENDLELLREQIELEKQNQERRKNMVKVEAIVDFTLARFDEIKNLQRKYQVDGNLIKVGDTFECEKDLADYLLGKNAKNIVVVKLLEIIPEKEIKPDVKIEIKPKKKKTSKK